MAKADPRPPYDSIPEADLLGVVGIDKACELLDCGRDAIYRYLKNGELISYLEDHRRRIPKSSIHNLIERRVAERTTNFVGCDRINRTKKGKKLSEA